jgi:nitrate reductase gamma subunit
VAGERVKAALWGCLVAAVLAALIVVGSRNLAHFDAALVGYTFATLFAAFGLTYRYAMWLQRPPTALYWRRGWQLFLRPRLLGNNLLQLARRLGVAFALNRFIWRRGFQRGLAHWLLMWGCLLAVAITFPLVFGWVHFETEPGDVGRYRTYVFGFPTFAFPVHSATGFLIFHGLVWASVLVILGVMLAMWRRVRDHGAAALQQFGEDFLPLILLFAVSITGLMLTASYTWMKGYGYEFLATLHAVTVIFTLLWLPFGKFFHIFQRPAQLGVSFYKDAGRKAAQADCRRCGQPFAPLMHVEDLITVERRLGYDYELAGPVGHYQRVCPRCRRALLALAQDTTGHGEATSTG